MSIETLWSTRFQKHIQNVIMYFARMISGLLYSFIFVSCVGAYYYAKFLKTSPSKGISLIIIISLLTIMITRCPIRTFIQKPDAVYLLALEEKLTSYFKQSLLYNYVIQLFPLLFTFLIITPLAMQTLQTTVPFLCTIFFILMLIKGWNLYINWIWRDQYNSQIWFIIRFTCNALILYMLFQSVSVVLLGAMLLLLVFLLVYTTKQPTKQIGWEYIIEQEEKMDMHFYQFANFFTEVPQLKKQVKQRKWLTSWLEPILHKKQSTFLYLNTLSFLRANDYFGIYIRLTIIGSFILYFVPNVFAKGTITCCLLYMTSMQLRTLWKYFSGNNIVALYPISHDTRINQFLILVFSLAVVQLVLFSIIIFAALQQFLLVLSTIIVSIFFIKFIILPRTKKRISSSEI
ncbi:ABC transporter permease [Bacillus pseudomycoides]|uniref:ABC transporter permease n=2 Tax=Bacillus cereus group TaxID=86661 RepID=A0AAJ1Z2C7_9BACI|nr:ABC transporter permease [Bacillus pseudomycoides]EEM12494.1 ABC transporter EcsB [Bacillus pseudomycoides]MDR4327033.1 ABC transporter permease [Bacillus pseudomycoides]MED1538910.1 ABC transporter permease [Bacillus pseudomycoides]PFY84831.1 permease [Bacillus pseudomycoides]PFZ90985.1 permease [Bacillus pseudomycoides]